MIGFFIFESVVNENGSAMGAKTIIVDANGTGNHTKIQDAIDAASDNDTIHVYAGNYNEYLTIDKKINIIGNSTPYPIINIPDNTRIWINSSNVIIKNFKINVNKFGTSGSGTTNAILIRNHNTTIENVIIKGKTTSAFQYGGIYTYPAAINSKIIRCTIYNLDENGITITTDYNNTVNSCNIYDCAIGIYLNNNNKNKLYNKIMGNEISDNNIGIRVMNGGGNEIYFNTINNNTNGLGISSSNNYIYLNNFINNSNQIMGTISNCYWNTSDQLGNYWSDYTGLDNGNGSREANDGIGDTKIPHLGLDDYPLMALWTQPGIVYVDDDFTNATLGWNWTHFNKIQSGIDAVKDGGMVYVYEGTYYENVKLKKSVILIGNGSGNTTIDGGGSGTVLYITADCVNISGFKVTNGGSSKVDAGIKLISAHNCSIINNNFSSNRRAGIVLDFSTNNIVENNIGNSNTYYGFVLSSSSLNKVVNNTHNSNKHSGIVLVSSSNNTLVNNTCNSNNQMGIVLYISSNNIISNNTCGFNNEWGIGLKSSANNNTIFNNTCSSNNIGIMVGSLNNKVFKNTMLSCGLYTKTSTHTIDISNTVNGKPVYYWKNQSAGIIPSGAGQIILVNCTNVIIENQNLSNGSMGIILSLSRNIKIINNTCNFNNWYGIELYSSTYNLIANNNCSDNYYYGIYLQQSLNNSVSNNTCLNNGYGIALKWYSSNNNTIINNTCSNNIYGISIYNSNNNFLLNNTLINNSIGIHLGENSDKCHIINTSIINSTTYTIQLNEDSHAFVLNSTLNWSNINYVDTASNLTVQWYLNVKVINNSNEPISDANININNNSSKPTFNGRTDQNGYCKWLICDQYVENSNGIIKQFSPYNVTANKLFYNPGYAVPEPMMNSSKTITITIYYDLTPPNPPSNLVFKNIGGNYINLSWTPSTSHDVEGYNIYINDTGTNSSFHFVGSTNDNYFNITALFEESTNYFIITAFDDVPWESTNLTGNCTTLDITPPNPPTSLKLSSKGGTFNNITWNASTSTDVQGYEIYVNNTGSTTQFHYLTNTTNTYFNHTGLAQETTYYYKVRAFDEVPLYSTFSNTIATKTLDITPPDPPTNLKAITIAGNYIRFSWTASISSDVLGYEIFVNDTGSTTNFHHLDYTMSTNYYHNDLFEEITYYYKVRAYDEVSHYSLFSNTLPATTLDTTNPAKPTGLTAQNLTGHSVLLTWDSYLEPDRAGYHVLINHSVYGQFGLFRVINTTSSSTTQYLVTGLVEITTYKFAIVAFDEVPNHSLNSDTVSIKTLDVSAPTLVVGSGDKQTTTGEDFQIHARFEDNVGVELVKFFYTNSTSSTWKEIVIDSPGINKYNFYNWELSIDTTNDTTPWIYYYFAEDASGNFVYYGTKEDPFIITVIDNDNPVADASGTDKNANWGETFVFDASRSKDNIGITNYTWTFIYKDEEIYLYGKITEFIFEDNGEFKIKLTVSDAARLKSEDTFNLPVWGYPPDEIYLVSPSDGSILPGPIVKLSWYAGTYKPCILKCDVYFGTEPDPPFYKANVSAMELEVPIFDETVDYYWKVRLSFSCTPEGVSETWSFRVSNAVPDFGLELTSNLSTVYMGQDQERSIQLFVKNIQDRYSDEFSLEFDQDNFPGEVELSNDQLIIGAGGEYGVFLNISTINSTTIGNYQLQITARSKGALEYDLDINQSLFIIVIVQNATQLELDSDNDNLPDSWEEQWFGDIKLFDGLSDPDLDGKTNLQEYLNNTDPTKSDLDKKPVKSEKEEDNTGLLIALVIIPVFIIILILLIIIFLKKKKGGGIPDEQKEESTNIPPSTQSPPPIQPPVQNSFLDYKVQEYDQHQDGFKRY